MRRAGYTHFWACKIGVEGKTAYLLEQTPSCVPRVQDTWNKTWPKQNEKPDRVAQRICGFRKFPSISHWAREQQRPTNRWSHRLSSWKDRRQLTKLHTFFATLGINNRQADLLVFHTQTPQVEILQFVLSFYLRWTSLKLIMYWTKQDLGLKIQMP